MAEINVLQDIEFQQLHIDGLQEGEPNNPRLTTPKNAGELQQLVQNITSYARWNSELREAREKYNNGGYKELGILLADFPLVYERFQNGGVTIDELEYYAQEVADLQAKLYPEKKLEVAADKPKPTKSTEGDEKNKKDVKPPVENTKTGILLAMSDLHAAVFTEIFAIDKAGLAQPKKLTLTASDIAGVSAKIGATTGTGELVLNLNLYIAESGLPYLVRQLPKSFGGGFEVIDRAEPNIIDVESAVDLMGVSDLTKKEETVWSFIIQAAGNPIRTRTLARILDIEPTEVRKIIQSLSVKVHAQKPNYNLVGAKTMPAGKTLAYKIEKLAPNTTAQEEAKKKLKLEDVFKIIESEHVEYPTITIKNGDEVFSAFGDLAKIILFLKNNNLINLQEGQITTRVDYKWLSQNRGSLFDERNGQLNLGEKFRVIFNSALTAGAHPFLQFSSTGKGLAVEYTVTFSEGTEILITLKEKTLVQKAWEYATKHNSGKPTVGHLLRDVQIVDRNIRATAQAEDPQFVECRSLQVLLGDKDIDELSLKIAELLLSKRSKPSSTVPCEGPYFDDIKQVWKIKHTDVQQYFGRFNANNSTLKGRKTGAKSSGTSVFTIAQAFETLFRTSDLNLSHTQQELLVEKVLENLNILR